MKKWILLLLLGSCLGCKQRMMFDDMAARLSGQYVVESYIINGDTLYARGRINKIDIKEFFIYIDRKAPDSLYIVTSYKFIGEKDNNTRFTRNAGVKEVNGSFQLSNSSGYESSITDHTFHERTGLGKGADIIIIPPSFAIPTTSDPDLEGFFITAHKALRE